MAYIKNHNEWNWTEGEIEAKRAIDLNPNYSLAHQWYAYYLRETGRTNQSLAEMRLALELDPVSEATNLIMAGRLVNAQRYSEAVLQLRDTENLGSRRAGLYQMFAEAYEKLGQQDEAARAYEEYLTAQGDKRLLDQYRRSLREQGYEPIARLTGLRSRMR